MAEPSPDPPPDPDIAAELEAQGLMVFANLRFPVAAREAPLLAPDAAFGKAKSASFNPASREVRGGADQPLAGPLMARYADWSAAQIARLAPRYADAIQKGRTSFRWREASDEPMSVRKDDRRLHADAFASQPTGGRRILRVFSNINPASEPRVWRLGEHFEAYAKRFMSGARPPLPLEPWLLQTLRITRERRTRYDALMLNLHDRAKRDEAYQAEGPSRAVSFAPGATWIVFSDSVVHAAVRGRLALEQTFYLPVEAMVDPSLSPLRILERLTGRTLA